MKDFQTARAVANRLGDLLAARITHIFAPAAEREDAPGGEAPPSADAGGDAARIAHLLRRFFAALAPAAVAALFGSVRLPLATYPLGLAVTAAGTAETPALAAGLLLGAAAAGNVPAVAGGAVLLFLRLLFSILFDPRRASPVRPRLFSKETRAALFREGDALRVCTAAVAAFTAGMVRLFAGGFAVGDLVGICFAVLVCPALTYLYIGYTTAAARGTPRAVVGHTALLVSFVFAAASVPLPLGFSAGLAAAAYLSMLGARRRDPLAAGVAALLFGFAASPAASPAVAVAALLFAILRVHIPVWLAAGAAVTGFAALGFLAGGAGLLFGALPEFLLGTFLAFLPLADAEKLLPAAGGRTNADAATAARALHAKSERETLADLTATFETMAGAFAALSDRETRVDLFDVRGVCDKVCDKFCRRCAACSLCWERDYAVTLDTLNKISAVLYKHGKVERADLPPEFLARCTSADRMLEEIERENARLVREMLAEDGSRRAAVDYAVFARVLSDALRRGDEAYAPDSAGRDAAAAALRHIGFTADSLGVFGTRQKRVFALRVGGSAMNCTADEISAALAAALGGRFEAPLFEFLDGGINMSAVSAPVFCADASVASLAAGGGEENGDRVHSFDAKGGRFYAVVNDGMGSGRAAAAKSARAALFLEKMLQAGNDVTAALELLSAMARTDREEGFTTVDLFMLDGFTGQGCFFKSGAAPSFVKRGDRIFKIRSRTVPIGILSDVDAEKTVFACEDGDAVVMLSDGVTEDIEEPLWLCEFLCGADLDAADAASRILAEAKRHTLCRDDMSAAVLHVHKISALPKAKESTPQSKHTL